MKAPKYRIGTILCGSKKDQGSDTNRYRIIKVNVGSRTSYDVVGLKDNDLHTDISEDTIDCYETKAPAMLDEGLFSL